MRQASMSRGYGFRTISGDRDDEVRLVSFVGASSSEVDRVLGLIKHREVGAAGDAPGDTPGDTGRQGR